MLACLWRGSGPLRTTPRGSRDRWQTATLDALARLCMALTLRATAGPAGCPHPPVRIARSVRRRPRAEGGVTPESVAPSPSARFRVTAPGPPRCHSGPSAAAGATGAQHGAAEDPRAPSVQRLSSHGHEYRDARHSRHRQPGGHWGMALATPHTSVSRLIACGARGGHEKDARGRASSLHGWARPTGDGGRCDGVANSTADQGSTPTENLGRASGRAGLVLLPSPIPVPARREGRAIRAIRPRVTRDARLGGLGARGTAATRGQ